MAVIIPVVQDRVKDTVASSPLIGLAVRANGEEKTQIIDRLGNVFAAELPTPTVAPTLSGASGGNLGNSLWYGYVYCYAASKAYPLIENEIAVAGNLYPRGNPSPPTLRQIAAQPSTNRSVNVTVKFTNRIDIDEVWIFRTAGYSNQAECQNAAEAGLCYYKGKITNFPLSDEGTYIDSDKLQGVDLVEMDNFGAPTFQFVVYHDPYWFGFGNYPFTADVTWDSNGLITLLGGLKWFNGRDGQTVTLSGITTGGYDNLGGYKFKWVSQTKAYATLDGQNPVPAGTFPLMEGGAEKIFIQGPSTTLYRSKHRNPFSWGWTRIIGQLKESKTWTLRVGGGVGTALAVVPNEPILKVDCEQPAKCFSFNLQMIENYDAFRKSRRVVSDVFSVTSHGSQFTARTESGSAVLWGIDYKNFAILQSNGMSQVPIAGPIPKLLRRLTKDRNRQLLSHGIYDPYTELNCLWVTTEDSQSLVNYLIFQHAPSGFWGFVDEKDVLCSANITNTEGETKTLIGTQTGLYGQAFAPGVYKNWTPDDIQPTGSVNSATTNSITVNDGFDGPPFATLQNGGIVGNWCLLTNGQGGDEQWCRIASATNNTLTFDIIISRQTTNLTEFYPTWENSNGWFYHIGVIECKLSKLFDMQLPATDKRFLEMWMTQRGVYEGAETLLRLYKERNLFSYEQFKLEAASENVFFQKTKIPSRLLKSFTLEMINRGYSDWAIYNYIMKVNALP